MAEMKECGKCKIEKEVTEFYSKSLWCKKCKHDYNIKWIKTEKGKESHINNSKVWRNKVKGVYGIFENDKCLYVGESKQLNDRMSKHKTLSRNPSYAKPYFKSLYQYLNTIDFTIKILEETPNHKEREQYWINQLKPKYNAKNV
jgi:hypothetical protein